MVQAKKNVAKKVNKTKKKKKANIKNKSHQIKEMPKNKTTKKPSKTISNKKVKKEKVIIKNTKSQGFIKKLIDKFNKSKISNAKKISRDKRNSFQKSIKKYLRKIKMYGITSVIPLKYLITGVVSLVIIITIIICLSFDFSKNNTLNLTIIPDKIDQITTVSFDIDDSSDIVTSSKAFAGLKDYYEYDFKKVFNLDKSYVSDYVIKYNKSNGEIFIVIKATDNNNENVKNALESFFEKNNVKNYLYKEYQGYQIFIKSNSTDNDAIVLSKIMQSNIRVFSILQELKATDIDSTFGIKESYYDKALVKTSMLRSDTCEYLIIKPKNANAKNKIINAMNDYYAGLESKWQGKNEDNYNLVVNRLFKEFDGYLIYIVSNDNNLVMDLIKG